MPRGARGAGHTLRHRQPRPLTAIVAVVDPAGEIGEGALGGGDPEVGGARVEEGQELLGRSAQGDGAVVLSVEEIVQRDVSLRVLRARPKRPPGKKSPDERGAAGRAQTRQGQGLTLSVRWSLPSG